MIDANLRVDLHELLGFDLGVYLVVVFQLKPIIEALGSDIQDRTELLGISRVEVPRAKIFEISSDSYTPVSSSVSFSSCSTWTSVASDSVVTVK